MLVNPPEQIFAEKLFSLAKIGAVSVRFKDVDIKIVRKCLELLVLNRINDIKDIKDVIKKAANTLENDFFINGYANSNGSWLKKDYNDIKSYLIDYIYKI